MEYQAFQKEPQFYKRLLEAIAYLSGYFHADGRGVSKEEMAKDSTYKVTGYSDGSRLAISCRQCLGGHNASSIESVFDSTTDRTVL